MQATFGDVVLFYLTYSMTFGLMFTADHLFRWMDKMAIKREIVALRRQRMAMLLERREARNEARILREAGLVVDFQRESHDSAVCSL
jgi:hypothetical protein